MSCLQSINDLSVHGAKKILDSIDYVFFDIDGALFYNKTPILGSKETVEKLRKLGKKIAFVTNNTFTSPDVIQQGLNIFGATENEIVTPNAALLAYLNKIDLKKDIYVIGSALTKRLLKEAGYNVIQYKDIFHNDVGETITDLENLVLRTLEVCKNVGAVFVDFDFNFCIGAVLAAKIILNHMEDVLFLTGVHDDMGNINKKIKLVASQFYIDGLKRWTKRDPLTMAKPGTTLKAILSSKFNISDDSRVLFVGDNVYADIAFGVNCGYQTYLVLSGVTSKDEVAKWIFPETYKPMFVSQSIGELYEKIKHL